MGLLADILKDMSSNGLETLGLYCSFYRALVVDNKDPEKMGRLKLMIPGISDESVDYWTKPLGMFSGKNYGMKAIPQKGAVVYVMFEMGDPSKPVWLQGYFGLGEMPEGYDNPAHYWFVTPGGASFEIHDEDGELTINDHHGNSVELNENGISLDVKSSKKKIFLGNINEADEPAVLGDTLKAQLDQIISNQMKINEQLEALGNGVTQTLDLIGSPGGIVMGAQVVAASTALKIQYQAIFAQVSLNNESIQAVYDKLDELKSETVRLDK